jgi:hypothetical protein
MQGSQKKTNKKQKGRKSKTPRRSSLPRIEIQEGGEGRKEGGSRRTVIAVSLTPTKAWPGITPFLNPGKLAFIVPAVVR